MSGENDCQGQTCPGQSKKNRKVAEPAKAGGNKKILVMLTGERIGHGAGGLGGLLLLNFLKTLKEMVPDLWRLVLINGAVKLTAEGADALPYLQELAKSGVSLLVCGTCLNHFQLLEKKQGGETTNMLDIVTSLQLADSVINL